MMSLDHLTKDEVLALYSLLFLQDPLDPNLVGLMTKIEKAVYEELTIEELLTYQRKR